MLRIIITPEKQKLSCFGLLFGLFKMVFSFYLKMKGNKVILNFCQFPNTVGENNPNIKCQNGGEQILLLCSYSIPSIVLIIFPNFCSSPHLLYWPYRYEYVYAQQAIKRCPNIVNIKYSYIPVSLYSWREVTAVHFIICKKIYIVLMPVLIKTFQKIKQKLMIDDI